MLTEWRMVTRDRDNRVQRAVSAGVSKYRINQLTGIGRSTIDRILVATASGGAINGPCQVPVPGRQVSSGSQAT